MVIAIPLALVVERHDKQIASLQRSQYFSAILPPGYRITQWSAERAEYRSLQQEVSHRFRLALQDFLGQIIEHKTVAAGKSLDKTGCIGLPLHRERPLQGKGCQLQPGDPAFRAD